MDKGASQIEGRPLLNRDSSRYRTSHGIWGRSRICLNRSRQQGDEKQCNGINSGNIHCKTNQEGTTLVAALLHCFVLMKPSSFVRYAANWNSLSRQQPYRPLRNLRRRQSQSLSVYHNCRVFDKWLTLRLIGDDCTSYQALVPQQGSSKTLHWQESRELRADLPNRLCCFASKQPSGNLLLLYFH